MLNKLAILIINYNKPEKTQALVNQINYYDNKLFDLTVIDNSINNGGFDQTVIKWLQENKRKEYAGYWLLNNDIVLDTKQDYIKKFLEYIDTDSEIGLISTKITDDYYYTTPQKLDLDKPHLVKYVDFHNAVITKYFLDKINFDNIHYFFGGLDFDLSVLANKLDFKILIDYRYSMYHYGNSNEKVIEPLEAIRYHLLNRNINIDTTKDFEYINKNLIVEALIIRYPELKDRSETTIHDKCYGFKAELMQASPIDYAAREFNIGLSKYSYPSFNDSKIYFKRAFIAGNQEAIGYLIGAGNYTTKYEDIVDILESHVDRHTYLAERSAFEYTAAQNHHFNISSSYLKTYVFYVRPDAGHPWDPIHTEEGIGGSEIAVINLSRELAKAGNKVYVFNRCAKPGIYDNVTWDNLSNFDIFEKTNSIDILIVSRLPEFRFVNPKTKVYYWAHDLNYYERINPSNWQYFDKFLILSRYHYRFFSNAYPWIPKENFEILANGLELERFNQEIIRNPKKLIYSSNPDRGLTILFDIFEELYKWDPELELHVFGYYPENIRKHPTYWRDIPGVIYRGYHKQYELAAEYLSSKLWLYPCIWLETFCITALEAQAAGTPCIVSEWSSLRERVGNAGIVIEGFVKDHIHKQKFIEAVKFLLTNENEWLKYSNAGREQVIQQTWTNSAQRLMEISNKCRY